MKTRNRRAAAAVLGLALLLSFLPVLPAMAADDYPYQGMTYGRYLPEDLDPWRFYYRECTSFVAWRLNHDNGLDFDNFYGGVQWGNAREWRAAAEALGIRVDNEPAVGAVYWQDANFHCSASGHVAWVKALNGDGTVVIEHYAGGSYQERSTPISYASAFIHIGDLEDGAPVPAPGPEPEPEALPASGSEPQPVPSSAPEGEGTALFPRLDRIAAFEDVPEDAWYASAVADVFAFGLMQGDGAGRFHPEGEVTVAEALVMAARIHRSYAGGGDFSPAEEGEWYLPFLEYALSHELAAPDTIGRDLTRTATRAQFAQILAAALPDEALAAINEVPDGSIPDVDASDAFAGAVYKLYRAGVLTGGSGGSFLPDNEITRAETAAIISRMADSAARVKL